MTIRIKKFRSYEVLCEVHTLGLACHPKSLPNKNEHVRTKNGNKRMQLHPVSSPYALLCCEFYVWYYSFVISFVVYNLSIMAEENQSYVKIL
jgi:hypothetical protein